MHHAGEHRVDLARSQHHPAERERTAHEPCRDTRPCVRSGGRVQGRVASEARIPVRVGAVQAVRRDAGADRSGRDLRFGAEQNRLRDALVAALGQDDSRQAGRCVRGGDEQGRGDRCVHGKTRRRGADGHAAGTQRAGEPWPRNQCRQLARRGIYDDMKTAVDRVGKGKAREVSPTGRG